jgi:hypothetical protein
MHIHKQFSSTPKVHLNNIPQPMKSLSILKAHLITCILNTLRIMPQPNQLLMTKQMLFHPSLFRLLTPKIPKHHRTKSKNEYFWHGSVNFTVTGVFFAAFWYVLFVAAELDVVEW